jgi:putative NADH-flavin reductase
MKIAVIGATGNAGSRITAELLKRGHHVRAIVRSRGKIHSADGLRSQVAIWPTSLSWLAH